MSQSPCLDLRPCVSEPIVLMISRREVEAADLPSVLSRLKVFLATREDAWRFRGQMPPVVHDVFDAQIVRRLVLVSGADRCRSASLPA